MFTGIIEEVGKICQISDHKIIVEANTVLENTKIGDSIAIDGVCLTVTKITTGCFEADVSPETRRVSAFSKYSQGKLVNLERAMPCDGRFGGHIVMGHVDGTGTVVSIKKEKNFYLLEINLSKNESYYVVKKGSICVNGISLTVADVNENKISIAVIPHTYENTNLKTITIGQYVNIENDIVSKYIEKFLSTRDNRTGIDMEFLQRNGF